MSDDSEKTPDEKPDSETDEGKPERPDMTYLQFGEGMGMLLWSGTPNQTGMYPPPKRQT